MPCRTGNNTVDGTEQHDSGALVLRSGLLESTSAAQRWRACQSAAEGKHFGNCGVSSWRTGAAAPPPAGAAAGWSCPGTLLPFPRFVCL